ncbi:MAG TPA: cell envelope integrity protein TolA [Bdellovibrionota bacterium]|nr:cell envelope integrity protein TolA [Bdellovibrionota bacterium]
MNAFEDTEFKRMVAVSTAAHLVALGLTLMTTTLASRRYLDAAIPGPMNVMWATTVKMPKATAPNKLPGPIVPPDVPAPVKPAEAKVVMPEDKAKVDRAAAKEKAAADEEENARRKAMEEALASVRREPETRPGPRADNFPSAGKGAAEGLPAGPGGVGGILGGNPIFGGYKRQVQQAITNNFVWIQRRDDARNRLRAEISFRIDAGGNILESAVSTTSGNPAFDSAALRAIRKSSPLPLPPQELAEDVMREQFVIIFVPEMK